MLELNKIIELLQDRKLSKVAENTGIHYNTLRAIRDQKNINPTYKVVVALSEYLEND